MHYNTKRAFAPTTTHTHKKTKKQRILFWRIATQVCIVLDEPYRDDSK